MEQVDCTNTMRKPWFEILEVTEARGPTMHDIVAEVSETHGVHPGVIRGARQDKQAIKARHAALVRVKRERPDLPSTQVALYFRRDSSTIRHHWRKASATGAA